MKVDEIRKLQWIYGVTKIDKIRNGYIKESVGLINVKRKNNNFFILIFCKHIQKHITLIGNI